MINILITGGLGFIGINLTRFLLENTDWRISILDNDRIKVHSLNKEFVKNEERITFIKGDITNLKDVQKAIKNCDYLVNLAAQTSVINSIRDPFEDEAINIRGLLNLLRLSAKNDVKRFIQASSAAVLGEQEMPMIETKLPKPLSPYGVSKLAGEAYCHAFSKLSDISFVVLRFSNVFGPYSLHKTSAIHKFIRRFINNQKIDIYGDGTQTRDFIYVKDVCNGIFLSLTNKIQKFNLYQLGTGIETSINSLLEMLSQIAEEYKINSPEIKYSEFKSGEIKRNYSDISKISKELGFSPHHTMEEGLRQTFNWYYKVISGKR